MVKDFVSTGLVVYHISMLFDCWLFCCCCFVLFFIFFIFVSD